VITYPGIYKDLSNEDYHKSKGISNSGIGLLIPPNCPKMYWYKYLSGEYEQKRSDDFVVGSAVHTLCLEPEKFESLYYVMPKIDRRTTSGKEEWSRIELQNAGMQPLTPELYEQVNKMASEVTSHAMFKKLHGKGCVEDSIAWIDEESGALLRSRPDFYNEYLILDVKTTKDVRAHGFSRSIHDFGYHRQGAMACDGLSKITGTKYDKVVLFVVSKEPPYLVKAYVLTESALNKGREEYKIGAKIYQECLENGYWPGYDEIIEDIDLPHWTYNEDNL
jgi:PDDEXK-like domain of unknown function (DUF3799)